jgi:hypothetical protein
MSTITTNQLLQETVTILAAKRTAFRIEADTLHTLVLGSSHGDFAFDPAFMPGAFNLCSRSQDLRHSEALYRKLSPECRLLETVVLFYSVFSSGSFVERSPSEKGICPALNEIFHLELTYEDAELRFLCDAVRGKLDGLAFMAGRSGFIPEMTVGFWPESYTAKARAADHMKLNKNTDANGYLHKLIAACKVKGHRLLIVFPPARSDYRRAIGVTGRKLFQSVYEIHTALPDTFEMLNLYDTEDFADCDFGDFDHLRPEGDGARYLTTAIREAVHSFGVL